MPTAEFVAPPEVLEALKHGRRFGSWIRCACPFCSDGRRGDRPLAANFERGFGRNRDRPGWKCHRCGAEKQIRDAQRQVRQRVTYDPRSHVQEEERRRAAALRMLEKASHIEAGDPVDRYLRGRGLRPIGALWPSSLRRAYLPHPNDRALGRSARLWPVMIAVVTDILNQPQAVHRTFLTEDGTKAPYGTVKMSLGPLSGHAVHLGVDSSRIVVGEGIESTLAAMMTFERVGWATLSAGCMRALVVPASVTDVIIAGDNDKPDRFGRQAGQEAANTLRQKLLDEEASHKRPIFVKVKFPAGNRSDFADFGS